MDWYYGKVISIIRNTVELSYSVGDGIPELTPTKRTVKRARRDIVRIASESELNFGTKDHLNEILTH